MPERALPGFRDFYPPELAERNHIMGAWRRVAHRFGFQEYDGPPLEPLELYTRKSGDEIVTQLYNFVDKGGREVTLRPEMTPTFARMVAARANSMPKPVRWFSTPQLFRYERQQKGRLREHFQLNVDIVGESDVNADAELVALGVEVMRELGLTANDVVVRISDRRLLNAVLRAAGVLEHQLPAVYAVVDKIERESPARARTRLSEAGITDATTDRILQLVESSRTGGVSALNEVLADTDSETRAVLADSIDAFNRYMECVSALGAGDWVRFDLSIVRGLAYYTGIVFEFFDRQGEHRAICGGGRYDTLLNALGGVDLPALGFGMGDVVIADLLRSKGLMNPSFDGVQYWVAFEDATLRMEAIKIVTELRRRGYAAEYSLREATLARQLKSASNSGARKVVIVQQKTFADGRLTLRDLATGDESVVERDRWLDQEL